MTKHFDPVELRSNQRIMHKFQCFMELFFHRFGVIFRRNRNADLSPMKVGNINEPTGQVILCGMSKGHRVRSRALKFMNGLEFSSVHFSVKLAEINWDDFIEPTCTTNFPSKCCSEALSEAYPQNPQRQEILLIVELA